jgi:uncharacterized protein (TIGR03083 family)
MTTFGVTLDLAIDELDGCRGLLLGATDTEWARATPLPGWDVEGLARHLAAVAWQQAEAFHRARVGISEPPSWLELRGDRASLLDTLSAAREHLAPALAAVAPRPDASVPLPFGTLPASIAASALVLEYGVHRADLLRALGHATDIDLDPDVARTVAELLPLLVPFLAEKAPVTPITYLLVADSASVTISWHDDAWHADDSPDAPRCEVRGSDGAISLLALGRIRGDHSALQVTGDIAAASALSDHIRNL